MAKQFSKASADESADAVRLIRSSKKIDPIYLLYGEDPFAMEQVISEILDVRFGRHDAASISECELYHAADAEPRRVVNAVRTIPLFGSGGGKVVIYRELERLTDADLEPLADYVSSPASKSVLILTTAKIDARRKKWSEIKKNSNAVSCGPLAERNLLEYIRSCAASHKLKIDPQAAAMMADMIGPNRAMIERSFEKILLSIGNGESTVSPQIIRDNVADTRERSIFELTKALTKRNIPAAITAIHALLEQKQEAVAINGMLARHVRMTLQVKIGLSIRMSEDDIAKNIGVNQYAMREYVEASSRYSLRELYNFHAAIFEADRSLKSKPVPPEMVLSNILINLMG